MNNIEHVKYTKTLRLNLYKSLETRFNKDGLIKRDVYQLSTFLDPNFGIDSFNEDDHSTIRQRLKFQLKLLNPIETTVNNVASNSQILEKRAEKYIKYKVKSICAEKTDDLDVIIDSYISIVRTNNFVDALDFWKCYQHQFPELSKLAKKYLGVQASSASVERMFNFAGHILSNKRRRSSVKLFENLVLFRL